MKQSLVEFLEMADADYVDLCYDREGTCERITTHRESDGAWATYKWDGQEWVQRGCGTDEEENYRRIIEDVNRLEDALDEVYAWDDDDIPECPRCGRILDEDEACECATEDAIMLDVGDLA
jgi:hypothetical protein